MAYGMARATTEWRPTLTDVGYPAILDQLSDPGLCLDGDSGDEGLAQPAVIWRLD